MRLRFVVPVLATLAASCSDSTAPGADEIVTVVAGNAFSCALIGERAWCWGKNDVGQLGRGTGGADAGPGLVNGDYRFRLLAAADRNVCGVTVDGNVLCWGFNRLFGAQAPAATPTLIPGTFPPSITSIGVGIFHGCVLASGAATCFGTNSLGELGNGTVEPSSGALGATTVLGGHSFSSISVGAFQTCGVESGDLWCWGTGFSGSMGPGTSPQQQTFATPTKLTLSFDVAQVALGSAVTCAIDPTSQTRCWGSNVGGQLGRGAGSPSQGSAEPTLVSQFSSYAAVEMPRVNSTIAHTCGLTSAGTAYCWGADELLQLGREATEVCTVSATTAYACSPAPASIASGLSFSKLALGRDHTCGLANDGEIYCWGSNARLQMGGTTSGSTMTPTKVIIPGRAP